jgi:hypothetical protein
MKNIQFFFLLAAALSITTYSCGQEPDPTGSEVYESCCGTEPVEFNVPGSTTQYVFVPNVFTPNEDGLNDKFMPVINEEIKYINYMVIKREVTDDTTSAILHDVQEIDAADMPLFAWDGRDPQGNLHAGLFDYTISFTTKDGFTYAVKGKGCSIVCGPEAIVFKSKTGCFYSAQAGGNGHLDMSLSHMEEDCFK